MADGSSGSLQVLRFKRAAFANPVSFFSAVVVLLLVSASFCELMANTPAPVQQKKVPDYSLYTTDKLFAEIEGFLADSSKQGDEEAQSARFKRCQQAAEQGDANAQFYLGVIYANGQGIVKDETEAVRWFRKAAEQGSASARIWLGFMYVNGLGVVKDEAEAVRWFWEAAEQGNAEAQFYCGVMYANGQGVLKDEEEAVRWFRKLTEQGSAIAEIWLGFMYANGQGVVKNEAEAVRWYRKAAKQGSAIAQTWLGFMYSKGRGVLKDAAEAVRWYRKAAEQGVASAQFNLAISYAFGEGGLLVSGADAADWYYKAGLSYLNEGNKKDALLCVERIQNLSQKLNLTVPNAHLAQNLYDKVASPGTVSGTEPDEGKIQR